MCPPRCSALTPIPLIRLAPHAKGRCCDLRGGSTRAPALRTKRPRVLTQWLRRIHAPQAAAWPPETAAGVAFLPRGTEACSGHALCKSDCRSAKLSAAESEPPQQRGRGRRRRGSCSSGGCTCTALHTLALDLSHNYVGDCGGEALARLRTVCIVSPSHSPEMHWKGRGLRGGPRSGEAGGWRRLPKRLGAVTVGYKCN